VRWRCSSYRSYAMGSGLVRLWYVLQRSIDKNKIAKFKFQKKNMLNVGKGCLQRKGLGEVRDICVSSAWLTGVDE